MIYLECFITHLSKVQNKEIRREHISENKLCYYLDKLVLELLGVSYTWVFLSYWLSVYIGSTWDHNHVYRFIFLYFAAIILDSCS